MTRKCAIEELVDIINNLETDELNGLCISVSNSHNREYRVSINKNRDWNIDIYGSRSRYCQL